MKTAVIMQRLTDLQGVTSKEVEWFFRLKTVRAFLINNPDAIQTKRGRNGGTWVNEDLLDLFNQWRKKEPIHAYQRFEQHFGNVLFEFFEGIEIIPQYRVKNYKLDWYIPSLKLAIEYDEEQHRRQKLDDSHRELIVTKELNCEFVRVKIGEEIQGLKSINTIFIRKYIALANFL